MSMVGAVLFVEIFQSIHTRYLNMPEKKGIIPAVQINQIKKIRRYIVDIKDILEKCDHTLLRVDCTSDEIRKLWADQPLAKQMGYTAGHFSFNNEGGRCEECKGDGTITVEMQFMADLVLECESCHGKRFKADTLEVKFQDKNIYDVLEMTVNQAIEFFTKHGQKKVVKKLIPLQDVGLGYIKLGQSSSTLSGGENQRVKLAYYLSQEKADPTLFIFDEPTTGLHFHDIRKLLDAFDALIRRGHSIVIIEHNMDVIKCADYVIDLGPEGGDKGGNIVATGTPEEVAACAASYTGQFLQEKLNHL